MRHFPNQCFICKPSRGRGGEGISLIKKFHDLPRNANHNEFLVQRYVENPLLMASKKFDIRLYIVIKGVDPIEAYLFEEGLARFCTVRKLAIHSHYSKSTSLPLGNHLKRLYSNVFQCVFSLCPAWRPFFVFDFGSKTTRSPTAWTCETCSCT